MAAYPAVLDITQPATFSRGQIGIRLVILIVVGWVFGWLYLIFPVAAAIQISQRGSEKYVAEAEQSMTKWLRLALAAYAYMIILTDRLPTDEPKDTLRFQVTPTGAPTVGATLLRIILAIPHAFVLGILGFVSAILVFVAAIFVLGQESYPAGIYNFNRGILRWQARLYVYLAGLADGYPPFALDTEPEGAAPPPATTPV